jgi:hypothetical protein
VFTGFVSFSLSSLQRRLAESDARHEALSRVMHTVRRVADVPEELVLGAHAAVVLAGIVAALADFLGLHMLGVEHQNPRGVMVRPGYGMR